MTSDTTAQKQHNLHPLCLIPAAYNLAQAPISNPNSTSLAHSSQSTILYSNPNTVTMYSPETKNWITALIVGILGLILAICGTIIALKQLRRTKRLDDVEAAQPDTIALREITAGIELTENAR